DRGRARRPGLAPPRPGCRGSLGAGREGSVHGKTALKALLRSVMWIRYDRPYAPTGRLSDRPPNVTQCHFAQLQPPVHSPAMKNRQRGFTLTELIVVSAIVAILLGIAIPSYKYITTSYRMSAEVNGLLGDLQ